MKSMPMPPLASQFGTGAFRYRTGFFWLLYSGHRSCSGIGISIIPVPDWPDAGHYSIPAIRKPYKMERDSPRTFIHGCCWCYTLQYILYEVENHKYVNAGMPKKLIRNQHFSGSKLPQSGIVILASVSVWYRWSWICPALPSYGFGITSTTCCTMDAGARGGISWSGSGKMEKNPVIVSKGNVKYLYLIVPQDGYFWGPWKNFTIVSFRDSEKSLNT
jgi:hypothetical protein